jgi:protein TonB
MNRAPVRGRLLGLALSGLVHLLLVAAVIALVRGVDPPMLFVDLAHGLDLAEQAIAGLGRAVADAGSHVSRPADGSRGKPDPGARGRAAPAPVPQPPSTVTEPAETRRAEAPAPSATPEPTRSAAESPPTNVPSAPQPRVVDPTPSALASAVGDTAAPTEQPAPVRSSAGDTTGQGASGVGASGHGGSSAAVSLSDAGGGGGQGGAARSGSRDGSPLALAVPGGGGDPAAADYAGYYDTLRRRLYESLTYPTLARRRGLSGTVLVDVEIDASGRLGRVTLVTSSSHALLDDAALEAVRGVSRVPFPPGVPPRRLLVRLPVVFEMR